MFEIWRLACKDNMMTQCVREKYFTKPIWLTWMWSVWLPFILPSELLFSFQYRFTSPDAIMGLYVAKRGSRIRLIHSQFWFYRGTWKFACVFVLLFRFIPFYMSRCVYQHVFLLNNDFVSLSNVHAFIIEINYAIINEYFFY